MIIERESEVRRVGGRPLYRRRDFSNLLGLKNLPDALMAAHLKLYEGYVKNTNLLAERLRDVDLETPEWAEMMRRVGFEINGMRLHELYFDNLSPHPSNPTRAVIQAVGGSWDSFGEWEREFQAMGQIRGVGWVILYRDPVANRFSNHWISLHEEGHPAGFIPLLVMDVWEHAYSGMERARYIEAFFQNIHWDRVEERLKGT
jgi:Fe-Mn family superoxide dismutase